MNLQLVIRILSLLALLAAVSIAQDGRDSHPSAERSASCNSRPEFRQFDFWLGEWSIKQEILQADGSWLRSDAETEVSSVLKGCALVEHWKGEVLFFWDGMKAAERLNGFSVRSFDPRSEKWVINWMDTRNPRFAAFQGTFADGKGQFFRTVSSPDGKDSIARITFSGITRSSVNWELSVSSDNRRTWQTLWKMDMSRKTNPEQRRTKL